MSVSEPEQESIPSTSNLAVAEVAKGKGRVLLHDYSNVSSFDIFIGGATASIFSLAYYVVPAYLLGAASLLAIRPFNVETYVFVAPIIASIVVPPLDWTWAIKKTRAFQSIPAYFKFKEIFETEPEDLVKLMEKQPVIMSLHPHGVFSFVSLCCAAKWEFWTPRKIPTAVASSILHTPILKHIIGILGLTSASAKPLVDTLVNSSLETNGRLKGCILYPGGTAELFLTSHKREILYVKQRKGFIRLALKNGIALCPAYLFGNTEVLKVLDWPILRTISRKTGVSLTYFWGRFYLPIPMRKQCMSVIGKPIMLPKIENPTDADVDKYLDLYISEITRIFDTYKGQCEGYEHKVLEFE